MFNFDSISQEKHNPNWPNVPDHPQQILIIGGSGSGKRNGLINWINNELDIDQIYLYFYWTLKWYGWYL